MDAVRNIIYTGNKSFLELIANDLYDGDEDDTKEFIDKYHKKNYSYMIPVINDVKNIHKRRIKNSLK